MLNLINISLSLYIISSYYKIIMMKNVSTVTYNMHECNYPVFEFHPHLKYLCTLYTDRLKVSSKIEKKNGSDS